MTRGSSFPVDRERSKTLVAATCAGVWIRTLTLLLSLDTVHRDDFGELNQILIRASARRGLGQSAAPTRLTLPDGRTRLFARRDAAR